MGRYGIWRVFLRMVERVKARRGEGVRAEERMMIEELYRALVGG